VYVCFYDQERDIGQTELRSALSIVIAIDWRLTTERGRGIGNNILIDRKSL